MKTSILVKVLTAGFLALVLLIPVAMVQSIVDERQKRRDEAIAEVSGKWGGAQAFVGPILTLPYRTRWKDKDGVVRTSIEKSEFLPDRLKIDGDVTPEIRRRGIFEVVLYGLELRVSGSFPRPDVAALGLLEEDVRWNEASVAVGLSDTRGLKEELRLTWDGKEIPFQPTPGPSGFLETGIHARLDHVDAAALSHPFAFRVRLQGSQSLSFAPLGVETQVALRSSWPNPSFTGAFLPDRRTIAPGGFSAEWKVSHFGRNFPQQWRSGDRSGKGASAIPAGSFGVLFFRPADWYQQATRAIKYAVLFVGLTFGAFFLFEIFARLRLHPLHYLLNGFALALFYLLLVSLSEHVGFGRAYAAAATATVLLVTGYAAAVLRAKSRAAIVGSLLGGLYGYLYILLRLEDYALLLGSLALFAILSGVMWLTRRIDWFEVGAAA